MRRFLPLAILVALISLALVACGGDDDGDTPSVQPTAAVPTAPPTTAAAPVSTLPVAPTAGTGTAGDVTRIKVVNRDPGGSGKYAFDPDDLSFNVGETVEFTLLGETEFHTFTVKALGIDVELSAGETAVIVVPFISRGEFELICVPHQSVGMKGTITVK